MFLHKYIYKKFFVMARNFWSLLCIYWYTVKIQSEAQVFLHKQQTFNAAWCWPFCTFPSLPVSPWPSFRILWPVSVHPPTSQWVPWWTWTVALEYPEWKNHIYIPQWNFHLHKEYIFFSLFLCTVALLKHRIQGI